MDIILATHNKDKVYEIKELVKETNIKIISLSDLNDTDDVIENGLTFQANALIKAKYFYDKYQKPVLADDSGLVVPSLNGEPGIYSARYSGGNDKDNNTLLLKNLINKKDRSAYYICSICFYDHEPYFFEGKCHGTIGINEQGSNGFGYDPIFIFNGQTFADVSLEEKNKHSHRAIALKKWLNFILK